MKHYRKLWFAGNSINSLFATKFGFYVASLLVYLANKQFSHFINSMATSTDTVVNVKSLTISRSDKMDETDIFDFDEVDNCQLYNEQGETVVFGDLYKHQKAIIIFVRVSVMLKYTIIVVQMSINHTRFLTNNQSQAQGLCE